MKKKLLLLVASLALFLMPLTAMASKGDQGVDWARYQGTNGVFGYSSDKFVISQLGGTVNGSIYEQSTYPTQVASAIAAGKRAHTYLWGQFGSSKTQAKAMLDYMLPKVQTPKGSIVALDYEDGASGDKQANTDAIKYALKIIADHGYTPMLYGYLNYFNAHVYLSQISGTYKLWLGEYPNYKVTPKPNYNYFPSWENVALFQFTSTYIAGGLDGNVDLTGITDNGYTSSDNPKNVTTAVKAGKVANNTPKRDIKAGDKVKVKFSAKHWSTGESIPSWVTGQTYKVKSVSGNKVLLSGINSWISKSNVEILQTKPVASTVKLPSSVKRESGTFTANTKLRVWNKPGTSYTGVNYYRGESVKYQGYIRNGNYIYAAYQSTGGAWHYVAVRENGVALGTFK
ncbi:endolysin [Lactobacillus phage phiJL-1]|uniref:lysozyme n=1 Tax=Lactobacillus phage phiJL-1 TaxID=2892345 RepID=Q597T9_9CAUD|nr:endolysin [Lactobacillus phage phiJL-1]AAP74532.1 putative lysin [Lactobacillus phage phiJL-1]